MNRIRRQPVRGVPLTCGLLVAAGLVAITVTAGARPPAEATAAATTAPATTVEAATPTTAVERARLRVRSVPEDWPGWAGLGFAALELGRATSDPAAYAEAGTAFATSLHLHPDGNDLALAGAAALANARHDFSAARQSAEQALAANPSSAPALAALTDAQTELGLYPQALATAQRLDAAHPGISALTRLSYQAELRGDLRAARALMVDAALAADTPQQVAFARAHEGLLALAAGDPAGARTALAAGRLAAPDDADLLHLAAQIAWETDDLKQSIADYAALVERRPTPTWAAEQALVLQAAGQNDAAETALAVARASYRLSAGSGTAPEGQQVLFEADHGAPSAALALARQVEAHAPSTGAADALAWALHVSGRDAEALPFADRALSLGGHPALWLYHRSEIRYALGDRDGARRDLTRALAVQPRFSPLHAPRAVALLASLGGRR